MKVKLLSDIHTEFHADGGRSFIESIDRDSFDVLVLAGDEGDSTTFGSTLKLLDDFKIRTLWVPGNHTWYLSTYAKVSSEIHDWAAKLTYVKPMFPRRIVKYGGVRFIGCVLWYPFFPEYLAYRRDIGDLLHIKDIDLSSPWMFEEHTKDVAFLRDNLQKDDVLITHMLPSYACVDPKYKGSPLNAFFVGDIGGLIAEREPKLSLFGHTHESVDIMIGNTRCVANPFGYSPYDLNPNFKENFIVEI